jgi:hypothetical protein
MIFFDFFCRYLFSERDDLISDFYTHARELVVFDERGLDIHIRDILKIMRIFEILCIGKTLSHIPSDGRTNTLSTDIYPSFESDISGKIQMFLRHPIEF